MPAAYAVHVDHSRGRRFPEAQHPYRNDFQRDRDRVIHARAFRRLEAKTQVFTRRYSDHFRNRLTHTLEVSQISRTIAGALGSQRRSHRSPGSGPRHRPPAVRPRRRKSAERRHARARPHLRPQPARAAHRRRLRAALRRLSRPEPDLRSPRRHHQALARLRGERSSGTRRISARPATAARSPAHRPDRRNRLQHRRPRRRLRSPSSLAGRNPRRRPHLRALLSRSRADLSRRPRQTEIQRNPEARPKSFRRRPDQPHTSPPASSQNPNPRRRPQSSRTPSHLQPRNRSRTQAKQRISSTKISITVRR